MSRVCVVVVTFNRKELLRRCLHALERQVGSDDVILVVDNASTDGTGEMLDREFPDLARLSLTTNGGGAGGFHAGMNWGHAHGYQWLWLMDDDGVPEDGCLDRLLADPSGVSVRVPIQQDTGGRFYGISAWRRRNIDVTSEILEDKTPKLGKYLFSFVGPLVPREVVDQVGLPRAEFFIWFDDYEYSLRIMAKTDISVSVVTEAIFRHNMGENARVVKFLGLRSVRSDIASWKIYYGVRNQLFTLLRTRRSPQEVLLFGAVHCRLMLMDVVYGPERMRRVGLRVRGAVDGTLGRLGKRV